MILFLTHQIFCEIFYFCHIKNPRLFAQNWGYINPNRLFFYKIGMLIPKLTFLPVLYIPAGLYLLKWL